MKRSKFLITALSVGCIVSLSFGAAARAYPQNIKFPNGFLPTTFKTANLDKWYKSYKAQSNLLPACNGGIRTLSDESNITKVESMGWSMTIAAYMDDQTTFDGLYKFYKSKLQGHGMMGWKTTCEGVSDGGSASDGDLDVAFALVAGYWQWGGTYKDEAVKVITTCKKLITNCSGTSVIVGGYSGGGAYGGCQETDISYFFPAYFRAFADITGDAAWTKLADDTYTVLANCANPTTGLVPDWHTFTGGTANGRNHTYKYDACRVPWRIALDYLWNGNEKAKEWCTKISNWANKVGPANIKDGYNLDGSAIGQYHNMSFVGGFAVAAMCNSQEVADAFGKEVASMSYDNFWYHAFLGTEYMLIMSGNLWNPKIIEKQDSGTSVGFNNKVANVNNVNEVRVTNNMNRELLISGIGKTASVTLATLSGRQMKIATEIRESGVSLDISTLGRGCYFVTIRDGSANLNNGQYVMIQ